MARNADDEPKNTNGYDPDVVQSVVQEIEGVQADIDEIMGEAKLNCAPKRDEIKEIKKNAADEHGIPRKAVNAVLAQRRAIQRAADIPGNLSDDQRDDFDLLKDALGDLASLPLGLSALEDAQR